MINLTKYIKRRITRAEKVIASVKEEHGATPEQTHTYHGGWSLGYWEGRLAALDDILYKIEMDNKIDQFHLQTNEYQMQSVKSMHDDEEE